MANTTQTQQAGTDSEVHSSGRLSQASAHIGGKKWGMPSCVCLCGGCAPVPACSREDGGAGHDASGKRWGKEDPGCKRAHIMKVLEETYACPSQDKPKQHARWSDTQSMV